MYTDFACHMGIVPYHKADGARMYELTISQALHTPVDLESQRRCESPEWESSLKGSKWLLSYCSNALRFQGLIIGA